VANETIAYDRRELRSIIGAFKAMDDEAIDQARKQSSALAEYAANEIKSYSLTRTFGQSAVSRIVQGVKISKSSKVGEFSFGFASQRFSGGASTRSLWGGYEFGSNRLPQFPSRNRNGYFIYPTLRKIQPQLVRQWQEAFSDILKKWSK